MDPLLQSDDSRFALFPIKYQEAWNMYQTAVSSFWVPAEVPIEDSKEWDTLTKDEKHFISHILAFFSCSDLVVNENLAMNFIDEVKVPEFRSFYTFQSAIESIHNEMYSQLIDAYIKDEDEKMRLFNAISTVPIVRKKAEWMMKWFDRSRPFSDRIVAFASVEGIFFSASFASIFWLKKRGRMPSLTLSNEFISKDEALHCKMAALVYKTLQPENRSSQETIHSIIREAVEIEKEFITEALPCNLIGINSELMCSYIEYVANYVLGMLGCEKIYDVEKCPLEYMDMISIGGSNGKTNFFESRVSQYAKAGVGVDKDKMKFCLDEDF